MCKTKEAPKNYISTCTMPNGEVHKRVMQDTKDFGSCGWCNTGTYRGYIWIDEVFDQNGTFLRSESGQSLYGVCDWCGGS